MDQSRPRYIALKSPLIDRSDLQSPRQRTLYGALTLAFWVLWFYLWLPLLALLAWTLGVQQAYKYMVVLEGYRDVAQLLGIYAFVIVIMGGALILWAVYNIIRFGGRERRTDVLPLTPTQIGQYFGQNPASVAGWQNEPRLYVTHDKEGHIARVETHFVAAAIPAT